MSSTRALRLLNSVEIGSTNATQLELLLSSSTGRLPELNVLFGVTGQASRIAMSQKTVETLVNSNTALSALIESGVLITAIANSPTARVAVKSSGAGVLRRLMRSRHNVEDVNSKWVDDYAWTRQTLPNLGNEGGLDSSATWKAITYGDKYVAIGYASSSAATSPDGSVWTVRQLPLTLNYSALCYGGPIGNLRYVAVAENTSTYIYSDDGLVWVAGQLPKLANWKHVYFRDGKFTAIAKGTTEVATSVDGIVWSMASSNNLFTQTVSVAGGGQGSAVTLALNGSGTATVPAGVTTLNITGRGGAATLDENANAPDITMPTASNWTDIAYGNGRFVAVALSTNKAAYSLDGSTWVDVTLPSSNWSSVAYGNGKFVITGTESVGLYSTDGITWNISTIPNQLGGLALTFGNGIFVNITVNKTDMAYSKDGINWLIGKMPSASNWNSVAYGAGRFVCIAGSGTQAAYSNDGINWTAATVPNNSTWSNIAYGAGKFVAIGSGGQIVYSFNGTSWTSGNMPFVGLWKSIAFGNGKFVAHMSNSTGAAYSTDGINWVQVTLPVSGYWNTVAYGAGRFVALSGSGLSLAIVSSEGMTWTRKFSQVPGVTIVDQFDGAVTGDYTIPKNVTTVSVLGRGQDGVAAGTVDSRIPVSMVLCQDITYGNGVYVGVRSSDSNNASAIIYSYDAINWTYSNITFSLSGGNNAYAIATVAFGNGVFVAASGIENIVLTSTDGINWTVRACLKAPGKIIFSDNKFVTVPWVNTGNVSNGNYSTDGINWTVYTLPVLLGATVVLTYGNGKYVAASETLIYQSTDLINWTLATKDANTNVRTMTYGGGKFMALGVSGDNTSIAKCLYSTNGLTWTTGALPINGTFDKITYGNGVYIGTKIGETVLPSYIVSADGINWTTGNFGVTADGMAYSLNFVTGRFMACGLTGLIYSSSDGTGWTSKPSFNGANSTLNINGVTYTWLGGVGASSVASTKVISLPGNISSIGVFNVPVNKNMVFTWVPPAPSNGATASVTVNGQAYTYAGSVTTTTPNSRTDTITLAGNSAVSFTYNCPVGTLVSSTFIAADVTVPATGTGSVIIPAGTDKLKITSRGAQGQPAIDLSIPSVPGGPGWDAIAYGNGAYVVIRGSNAAPQNFAYSTDGLTWTKGALPGGATGWTDITYGNGKFVVVRTSASDQIFAYSTDGIVWSVVTPTVLAPSAAGNWKKVTYGAGKFVAVGSGSSANVLYSTDGINWTTSLITGGLAWTSVIYGNDRFVAVSYDAAAIGVNNIAYSTDGLNWTRTGLTGDTTARYQGIAYGNGKFLAVGNKQVSSTDGLSWALAGTSKNLTNVIFTLNQFIAFSAETNELNPLYSTDVGVTWTQSSLGGGSAPSGRFKIAAYGASRLVSIATADSQIAYSTDGRNWVTSTPQTTGANTTVTISGIVYTFSGSVGSATPASRTEEVQLNINAPTTVNYSVANTASCTFAYSGGGSTQVVNTLVTLGSTAYNGVSKYVAVAYDEHTVASSPDGINWNVSSMPANVSWRAVSYGNGVFVAVAYDTSIAATSTDGVNWTQRALPTSTKWCSIAYGSTGGHVTLAEFSSINATSNDGITWIQRAMTSLPVNSIESGQLTNVPLSGSGSVIIPSGTTSVTINGRGAAGVSEVTTAIYGPDGATWTKNLGLDASNNWTALAFGNGKFIAAKYGTSTAAYSTDGINWTSVTLPFANAWTRTVYAAGKFVLIGKTMATTSILYSTDGITWLAANQPATGRWEGLVYGNSKFVAVNSDASDNLTSSSDGITWTRGSVNSGTSEWRSVDYGNGKFVAVGTAVSSNVAYSVDGISWTTITVTGLVAGLRDLIYSGTKFVAVETSGIGVISSTDGITWVRTAIAGYGGRTFQRLIYAGNVYVILGNATANGVADILRSTDGVNWTAVNTTGSVIWNSGVYGGGKFVMVGNGVTSSVGISADIVTGSQVTTPAVVGTGASVAINSVSYSYAGSNTSTPPVSRSDIVSLSSSMATTVTYSAALGTNVYLTYIALGTALTAVTPLLPVQAGWIDAAYGNGVFVTVATGSNVAATSPDGISWTQRTLPVSTQWNSISFSNGIFVALSATGSIGATSSDGISWTQRALPQIATSSGGSLISTTLVNNVGGGAASELVSASTWECSAYGNGVYVVLQSGNPTLNYSTDGINWSNATLPSTETYYAVIYGNGRFIAAAVSGVTAYSVNGITWTAGGSIASGGSWGLSYANGKIISVGNNNRFASTVDGVTWASSLLPGVASLWSTVAFGAGMIVASGNRNDFAYSNDGINWTAKTFPSAGAVNEIIFANGKFVASSQNGNTYFYSTDGINWTTVNIPSAGAGQSAFLAYGAGRFVSVTRSNGNAVHSTDGINWTAIKLPDVSSGVPGTWSSVIYDGISFLAFAYSSKVIARSVDGITWNKVTSSTSGSITVPLGIQSIDLTGRGGNGIPGNSVNNTLTNTTGGGSAHAYSGAYPRGLAYGNGKFVVACQAGNKIFTSTNGYSWSDSIAPLTFVYPTVVYGNGRFVIMDGSDGNTPNGRVAYSTDGSTWTIGTITAGLYSDIAFGAGKFVTISYNGSVYTSTDGATWANTGSLGGGTWYSIIYGAGKFVAVGQGNQGGNTSISTDGITWALSGSTTGNASLIEFGNGVFVSIITNTNVAKYSTDGINWTNVNIGQTAYWFSIAYTGNGFIAVAVDGYKANSSSNGVSWSSSSIGGNGFQSVAYGNNNIVAVGFANSMGIFAYGNLSTSLSSTLPNNAGSITIPSGINKIYVTGKGAIGNEVPGTSSTVLVNGISYSFTGSTNFTTPEARTEIITLNGDSSVNVTFSSAGSNSLSLSYTPITQGEALVISVNGTNYTYPGSTTDGPAASRTDTINGLGDTAPTIVNYSIKSGKTASLAYTDAMTSLSHAAWTSSAYGSGVTAAVSSSGTHAATSLDGATWLKRALPDGVSAADVVYGNGLFVAIGSSNKAAISVDGISWSQRSMPDNLSYRSIAFGNSKYVTVASGGLTAAAAAISVDGIAWTAVTLPIIADWRSIAYKDGLFFAVASNTDKAITSPDGVIWTVRTLPVVANWAAVTNSDKRFVLISNGSTVAAISFNGATFNQSGPSSDSLAGANLNSRWSLVAYGASVFVTVAKLSTVSSISSDGISWTPRTLPAEANWNALTYGNGKFVLLAENSTVSAYSADGSTWQASTLPVSQRWINVVAGPRLFVAIAKDTSVYLTSKDGITWTARNLPEVAGWTSVRYGSGRFVVTNDSTTRVAVSSDGINWSMSDTSSSGLVSLTYGNGVFVGVATNDAGIDVSSDGYNWTQYGLPSISDWSAIHYGNGVFVVIAYNNAIVATSVDGVTWKQTNLPAAANWKNIAYGDGIFLGISDSKTAVTNC